MKPTTANIRRVSVWEKIYIIHDRSLLSEINEWLFSPATLSEHSLIQKTTTGRKPAYVFHYAGKDFVLRHFWRGGLVGRIVDDIYLWLGLSRARPVREWQLLSALSRQGLPVPQPAALRIVRRGLSYRADLITVYLPDTHTLADCLTRGSLAPEAWRKIGAAIARLHRSGACHADLNARNILLQDGTGQIYVIDWDRGQLRKPQPGWQQNNLSRLRRSLDKLAANLAPFHYQPDQFDHLLAGYRAAI